MITILSGTVVCVATFFMCVLEPEYSFMQLLFEVVSAFGTVGLSTGITPALSVAGKAVIILVMFTGRVGAFNFHVGEPYGTKSKVFRRRSFNRIIKRENSKK